MTRDTALLEECRALVEAIRPYPTLETLHASPGWPALEPRIRRLLNTPRLFAPPAEPVAPALPGAIRAVHWNLEHGNRYEMIERALLEHSELRGADLVFLNETDLGMARSGNRDIVSELARALGLHGVFAPLFLETSSGRDDDGTLAGTAENQEALFGLGILSRWPVAGARIVELPSPERFQFEVERMVGRHVGLIVTVERPGAPFVAAAAHLEVHRSRAHRAAQMHAVVAALRDETLPVILAGDFNSHTFDRGRVRAPLMGAGALLLTPGWSLRRRLLHPDQGPLHELLFDELRRAGFEWAPYVDRRPTLQLRLDRLLEARPLFGSRHRLVRRVLGWAEERGKLRLDWFAGRGWESGRGFTVPGLDGIGRASDHAPIVAEFRG
ncbi:MAG TPA: endonuclease/exonuclease/phosphatase family protein [Terriglobales bacterium]|nr:endonuclease/exonuclease/phosphatase family protein [Terriglobales bacterium]